MKTELARLILFHLDQAEEKSVSGMENSTEVEGKFFEELADDIREVSNYIRDIMKISE